MIATLSSPRPMRTRLRRIPAAPVALLVCAGCRAAIGASPRTPDARESCRIELLGEQMLRDRAGRYYVVEPQAVASNGREVFVAGSPSIELSSIGDSWRMAEPDTVFGAIVAPGKPAQIVPSPAGVSDTVDGATAVAHPDGSWSVIFMETDSAVFLGREAGVRHIRYGRYGPSGWGPLETLPFPSGFERPHYYLAGPPILAGDSLVWAVTVNAKEGFTRGLLFVRFQGRWSVEVIPTSTVVYAVPGWLPTTGLLLAVIRPDSTEESDANSLFIFARRPVWKQIQRVMRGNLTLAHHPRWVATRAGLTLGWRVIPRVGPMAAITGAVDASGIVTPRDTITGIRSLSASFTSTGGSAGTWLTRHAAESGDSIRITRVDGRGRSRSAAFALPEHVELTRLALITGRTRDELLMFGHRKASSPGEPGVASIFVHARLRCARPRR